MPTSRGILRALALDRPELRSWAMYDWAASAVQTTIMVAVFPIYYTQVAGAGLEGGAAAQHLAIANAIEIGIVALFSPVLGAIADVAAVKKKMLAFFLAVGAISTGLMFFIQRGDLMLATILFVLSLVGVGGSYVFYESLLPHIARGEEMDRVSTSGYALGYIGGGILLLLNLLWIQQPGWFGLPSGENLTPSQATLPVRLSFLSVAVWWVLFSSPLFRGVREPRRRLEPDETPAANPVRLGFSRLGETFRELRGYKQAFLMLLAFLVYSDGIGTIQRMATAYGAEIGIDRSALITAILLVQFVGIPFTFLFGFLAARMGTKKSIFAGLFVYAGISILGYFMSTTWHFYLLAFLVGMVQGGTQALSRSLFASIIPRHKSGEFFGFFSVFSKFAGLFGPLLFALAIELSGSSRNAILSVIAFFIVGGVLLAFVDVDDGQRVARAADAAATPVAA